MTIKNTKAPIELLGMAASLNPGSHTVTSERLDMFRSHASQAILVDGVEPPLVMSGLETHLQTFERLGDASGAREKDGVVVAVVPKYGAGSISPDIINDPPTKTIIFIDSDNKLDYFNADQHFIGSEGFGFKINRDAIAGLGEGSSISKDEMLVKSPAICDGGVYAYGINANVAYMSAYGTFEDAMVVSESYARKARLTRYEELEIPVNASEYPLNLFGDAISPVFLVNIGDIVGEDGVLCAFRKVTEDSLFADLTTKEIDYLSDTVYRAPPGARIIDIEFYTSPTANYNWDVFAQVDSYTSAKLHYWKHILDVYRRYKKSHALSPKFNELVTTALQHTAALQGAVGGGYSARGKKRIPFVRKKGVAVEFLEIHVKYALEYDLDKGFKLSDRHGTKGVVSQVLPDEQMPMNEYGYRADIIIDPGSAISRMNPAQIYEPTLNCAAADVRDHIRDVLYVNNNIRAAWAYYIDFINDINPEHRVIIEEVASTDDAKHEHIQHIIEKDITMWVPPFLDTMYVDDLDKSAMRKIEKKWLRPLTPVTHDLYGTGSVTTNVPVMIAKKYMLTLAKVPEPSASGFSHLSSHGLPAHAGRTAKSTMPHSTNPVRLGEDELRMLMHDVDPAEIRRFLIMNGSSLDAGAAFMNHLLVAENPGRIARVPIPEDVMERSDIPVQLLTHALLVTGVDINQKGNDE